MFNKIKILEFILSTSLTKSQSIYEHRDKRVQTKTVVSDVVQKDKLNTLMYSGSKCSD